MGEIRVLSDLVADMIAAGEVVERPASAVKELVENSIDAGADTVTIEVKNGGRAFLRVSDNGSGIRREDVPAAFLRHATSKIRTAEDLMRITTLGFRGEALASIAAVARVEVLTRHVDEPVGTRFCIEAGQVLENEEVSCPTGTTIIVRSLFFNVPARQKFLKSDRTETACIGEVVDRVILSHPELAVRYINNGRQEAASSGSGNLADGCAAVFGRENAGNMLPVDREESGVGVRGLLGGVAAVRGNRAFECFFVNGRFVKSRLLSRAVESAFGERLQRGKFPICALSLTMHPQIVDVNVHPQKTEVKFAAEKQVFDAVYWACADALEKNPHRFEVESAPRKVVRPAETALPTFEPLRIPETDGPQPAGRLREEAVPLEVVRRSTGEAFVFPLSRQDDTAAELGQEQGRAAYSTSTFDHVSEVERVQSAPMHLRPTTDRAPDWTPEPFIGRDATADEPGEPESDVVPEELSFRLVGQLFDTYLVVEQGNQMLLIDQHAAHERINYERIWREFEAGAVYPQLFLEPVQVELSKTEHAVVLENAELLLQAGFSVEAFGGSCVLVRQAPYAADAAAVREMILEIADSLMEMRGKTVTDRQKRALYTVACKASVRGNQRLTPEEQEALVRQALRLNRMETCPHGRPIVLSFTKYYIEKQFKRV